jgi:putative flippase GtrA
MRDYIPKRAFRRFVVVGGLGFCVDGGLLTILMVYGWDVIPARCCSFFLAVSATWILNRFWTFDSVKRISFLMEYAYYFGTQVLGAAINLSIFFVLIWTYPLLRDTPLIPLAFGATVSLGFNYFVSKLFVFKSEDI